MSISELGTEYHLIGYILDLLYAPEVNYIDEALMSIFPEATINRNFWLVTHKDNRSLERIKAGKDWLLEIVKLDRMLLCPAQ